MTEYPIDYANQPRLRAMVRRALEAALAAIQSARTASGDVPALDAEAQAAEHHVRAALERA